MHQPDHPEAPRRFRLVDYSDSESDPGDEPSLPAPEPATHSAERPSPETENELAKVVIAMQEKYTHEVEHLEKLQDDMRREVEDWRTAIEDRMRMQLKLMTALVKEVFNVDVSSLASREDLPQVTMREVHVEGPPSPSPTPSVPGPGRDTAPTWPELTTSLKVSLEATSTKQPSGDVGENEAAATTSTSLPQKTRSTGKKAPRPITTSSNRRPYQPSRKAATAGGKKENQPREAVEDGVTAAKDVVESAGHFQCVSPPLGTPAPPQQQLSAGPLSPYDDPKYFSPLTVTDEKGIERPIFRFNPHPGTVEDQWAEYKYGLHDQPPVEHLEKMYRARWRNGDYARSWFTRRKAFWDKMKEMLAEGKTEEEALSVMKARANGSVPALIGLLCKERVGKGTRSGRKRKRAVDVRERRSMCRSSDEEAVDSGTEGADEAEDTGRLSPRILRRKRVRAYDVVVDPGLGREKEVLSVTDEDEPWKA